MTIRPAYSVALLLFASACASNQVAVETPTTPPDNGFVSNPSSPTTAPTSANTVDPAPVRLAPSDTTARPKWLQERIANVLSERKRTPTIRILSYQYGGQTVYYQSAPCCDQFSTVFDTKGKVICNPDGGITGKGDGKCPDFDKNKSNEKLVWQDPDSGKLVEWCTREFFYLATPFTRSPTPILSYEYSR